MREFSVPPVASIGDSAIMTDPVWDNADGDPHAVQFARRVDGQWQDVTCQQFRSEVVALARGLVAAGLQTGDRVGLMSKTRYEWTLIDYAIWAAGAVTVPIYETSSAEQVAWILSAIEELVADGATVPAEEIERRRHAVGADDLATIIYTSGTTGRPKGCVLTHRNLYFDIANAIPKLGSLFRTGASTLLFLPLAHSFARIIQVGCVQARTRMGHTADVKNLVAELQGFQPTFILSVPRVFEKVHNTAQQRAYADGKGGIFKRAERTAVAYSRALDQGGPGLALRAEHGLFNKLVYGKLRDALGGRCTSAISGGAPLGERLAHFFRGIGLDVREGYGLTETSPVVAANFDDGVRLGTVGRPLPGVTVRIADDGEVLILGDNVFKRYWNNEAATAEALDADGWFHSGDIGELDDDGFLRITGRKKELIVTAAGKNVAPAVLEDRLRGHPLVSHSMVIGDRRPFIATLVTLDEDALPAWKTEHGKPADATARDLRDDEQLRATIQEGIDYANRAVSHAEAIKSFRILPRDFTEATGELTPSLKVKRNVVLKEYADEIAAIYGS